MWLRQRLETLAPRRGELQPDDPVVLGVAHPLDQPGRYGPVDEADGAVVAEEEVVGHLADRRPPVVGVPSDGQQQLLLRRRQPGPLGLLLAPAEEPAQPGPQRQQILVVGVAQSIVSRYPRVTMSWSMEAGAAPAGALLTGPPGVAPAEIPD